MKISSKRRTLSNGFSNGLVAVSVVSSNYEIVETDPKRKLCIGKDGGKTV